MADRMEAAVVGDRPLRMEGPGACRARPRPEPRDAAGGPPAWPDGGERVAPGARPSRPTHVGARGAVTVASPARRPGPGGTPWARTPRRSARASTHGDQRRREPPRGDADAGPGAGCRTGRQSVVRGRRPVAAGRPARGPGSDGRWAWNTSGAAWCGGARHPLGRACRRRCHGWCGPLARSPPRLVATGHRWLGPAEAPRPSRPGPGRVCARRGPAMVGPQAGGGGIIPPRRRKPTCETPGRASCRRGPHASPPRPWRR